ncbi:MAG: PhzF family phenazine biosynthesis protein [Clostridiales bacterium]|nr:PhzF family phenazine biosynthesis protein [Clostridiales bacterium]
MEVNIFQVDAFSSRPFGGNPTIVVLDSRNIDGKDMQKIANEMNTMQTTFVDQLADDVVKVRFFSRLCEMDLCGHGTIATFYTMANKGYIRPIEDGIKKITLDTNIGKLNIELNYRFGEVDYIVMEQGKPKSYGIIENIEEVLQAMNLEKSQIGIDNLYYEPEIISTGAKNLLLPINDKSVLENIDIDFCSLKEVSEKLKIRSVHAFYLPKKNSEEVYARNFSPIVGINEEPATGTASGALIYYLKKNKLISSDRITSLQGESMNRPSKIYCFIEEDEDEYKVKVGGDAVIVMEGILKY